MQIRSPLEILELDALPGVAEASKFRRACVRATGGVGEGPHEVRIERMHATARVAVICAIASYRAGRRSGRRECLAAADRARAAAMRVLFDLHRDGVVPARLYDEAASASGRLRSCLGRMAVARTEEEIPWES
jgi:hypothetical protein